MIRPSATLGPVVENSLNLVVPISIRPTKTVPALVRSAGAPRRSVTRIAASGFLGSQCSANRQETKRQKSVPLPNSTTIRNSSTRGEISHPSRESQARTPRAITRQIPIVTSGIRARRSDRYTISRTPRRRTIVASAARSSEVWTFAHVVAADGRVAGPGQFEAVGGAERGVGRLGLEPVGGHLRPPGRRTRSTARRRSAPASRPCSGAGRRPRASTPARGSGARRRGGPPRPRTGRPGVRA